MKILDERENFRSPTMHWYSSTLDKALEMNEINL